jgi:hypothetical protein
LAGFDGRNHHRTGEKLAEQLMATALNTIGFRFHIKLIMYQMFSFLKSIPYAARGFFRGGFWHCPLFINHEH